jgi:hypothetical protein
MWMMLFVEPTPQKMHYNYSKNSSRFWDEGDFTYASFVPVTPSY